MNWARSLDESRHNNHQCHNNHQVESSSSPSCLLPTHCRLDHHTEGEKKIAPQKTSRRALLLSLLFIMMGDFVDSRSLYPDSCTSREVRGRKHLAPANHLMAQGVGATGVLIACRHHLPSAFRRHLSLTKHVRAPTLCVTIRTDSTRVQMTGSHGRKS